jgi:hypothetical protein
MHLTVISGYELGQFLRILLWICVPIAMCALLVTTWLQYRRRQTFTEGLLLSMEGVSMEGVSSGKVEAMPTGFHDAGKESGRGEADAAETAVFEQSKDDRVEEPAGRFADSLEADDYRENLYKGILWMKDKYEQYRDMADQRYERLKEQLTKVEKRYEELLSTLGGAHPLAGAGPVEPRAGAEVEPTGRVEEEREEPVVEREERTHTQELEEQLARTRQRLEEELGRVRYQLEEEIARSRRQQDEQAAVMETNRHLEQQMVYSNRQLEEKQRIIADLEVQLRSDRQKIEELVTKLRNNSQLFMKIYQELDKSLHFNDIPKEG